MVHPQVDILSLWGHTPKTLTTLGLREFSKHNCSSVPPKQAPNSWLIHSNLHSLSQLQKTSHPGAKSLKGAERDGQAELRGRSANTSVWLCGSCDHWKANRKTAKGVLPTLLGWIQCLCERLSTSPYSGGKYKYHWNADEVSRGSRGVWEGLQK